MTKSLSALLIAVVTLGSLCRAQTYGSGNDPTHDVLTSDRFSPQTFILPSEVSLYLRMRHSLPAADEVSTLKTSTTDSVPRPPSRRLLPDKISFMENGLWGENGLFRKIGLASELTPESRASELRLRRTMLTIHQIGGFITLGSMMTATYFGQKLIDGDTRFRSNHQIAVTATIVSYTGTSLMAILAPPPLIRRDEVSTTTIHKTLAWIHFVGMIATPILGGLINEHEEYDQRARFHQVSAYITTAALAASMIVISF